MPASTSPVPALASAGVAAGVDVPAPVRVGEDAARALQHDDAWNLDGESQRGIEAVGLHRAGRRAREPRGFRRMRRRERGGASRAATAAASAGSAAIALSASASSDEWHPLGDRPRERASRASALVPSPGPQTHRACPGASTSLRCRNISSGWPQSTAGGLPAASLSTPCPRRRAAPLGRQEAARPPCRRRRRRWRACRRYPCARCAAPRQHGG